MKPRMLILTGILEAALLLAAVYFEPTYSVRGHLHGEAFFEGKSTSWWRHELEHWDVRFVHARWHSGMMKKPQQPWKFPIYNRQPSWFEEHWKRWSLTGSEERDAVRAFMRESRGPRLMHGGDSANDVLNELLDDPSPKIRRMARLGLGLAPAEEDGTDPP